jgi:Ribulose-phosphate 3 epimerase family
MPRAPIGSSRCDGRPLRAQQSRSAGRAAGHTSLNGKAAQRASTLAPSRRPAPTICSCRQSRDRPPICIGAYSDPGAWKESRRGARPGEPGRAWRVLHLCDVVLVMTVNPGFGGGRLPPEMLPKIWRLRAKCAERHPCGLGDLQSRGLPGGPRKHPRRRHDSGGQIVSAVRCGPGAERAAFKHTAAETAVELVWDGAVVGLGTGSTGDLRR